MEEREKDEREVREEGALTQFEVARDATARMRRKKENMMLHTLPSVTGFTKGVIVVKDSSRQAWQRTHTQQGGVHLQWPHRDGPPPPHLRRTLIAKQNMSTKDMTK